MPDPPVVREILRRLAKGNPLGELDTAGFIRLGESRELTSIVQEILRFRGEGPTANREVFWLVAPHGGGKTETLNYLYRTLIANPGSEDDYKSSSLI